MLNGAAAGLCFAQALQDEREVLGGAGRAPPAALGPFGGPETTACRRDHGYRVPLIQYCLITALQVFDTTVATGETMFSPTLPGSPPFNASASFYETGTSRNRNKLKSRYAD